MEPGSLEIEEGGPEIYGLCSNICPGGVVAFTEALNSGSGALFRCKCSNGLTTWYLKTANSIQACPINDVMKCIQLLITSVDNEILNKSMIKSSADITRLNGELQASITGGMMSPNIASSIQGDTHKDFAEHDAIIRGELKKENIDIDTSKRPTFKMITVADLKPVDSSEATMTPTEIVDSIKPAIPTSDSINIAIPNDSMISQAQPNCNELASAIPNATTIASAIPNCSTTTQTVTNVAAVAPVNNCVTKGFLK